MCGNGVDKRTVIVCHDRGAPPDRQVCSLPSDTCPHILYQGDVFGMTSFLIAWTVHHHSDHPSASPYSCFSQPAVSPSRSLHRQPSDAITRGVRRGRTDTCPPAPSPALVHHHAECYRVALVTHLGFYVVQLIIIYIIRQFFYHHGIYNLTISIYDWSQTSEPGFVCAERLPGTTRVRPGTSRHPHPRSRLQAPPSPTISVSTAPWALSRRWKLTPLILHAIHPSPSLQNILYLVQLEARSQNTRFRLPQRTVVRHRALCAGDFNH